MDSWERRLAGSLVEPPVVATGYENENVVSSVKIDSRHGERFVTVTYRPSPGDALCAYVERIEGPPATRTTKQSLRSEGPEEYAADVLLEIASTVVDSNLPGFVAWNEPFGCHLRYWGEVTPDDVWCATNVPPGFDRKEVLMRVRDRVDALLVPTLRLATLELTQHGWVVECRLSTTGLPSTLINTTDVPLYLSEVHSDSTVLADGILQTFMGDIVDDLRPPSGPA